MTDDCRPFLVVSLLAPGPKEIQQKVDAAVKKTDAVVPDTEVVKGVDEQPSADAPLAGDLKPVDEPVKRRAGKGKAVAAS